MDKRKHYIMVLDTETANTISNNGKLDMSNVLVYDCGWAIVDTKGKLYETASYINSDIFINENELMKTAYYAEKIPRYKEDIKNGSRKLVTMYQLRKEMLDTIKKYGIKEVAAHNARFDYNALNVTTRYITKSQLRYWFPFNEIEIWDTMKMANDIICKKDTYKRFCEQNGYLCKNGSVRKTAEILYRFISGNNDFAENHTGLEDVLIESQILWYCLRQHKPMRKKLYENSYEYSTMTEFQKNLLISLKTTPMLATV